MAPSTLPVGVKCRTAPPETPESQSDRRTDPSIRRARFQGLAPKTPLVTRTRARSWEKGRAPCRLPGVTAER